jgi:hypothetical protein
MKNCAAEVLILVSACSADSGSQPVPPPAAKDSTTGPVATSTAPDDTTVLPSDSIPATGTLKPWDATGCGDDNDKNEKMERHPDLMGLTIEQLTKAYGKPATTEAFKVGTPQGIFYGPYGRMPAGREQANTGQPAQILTWTKNGCNFSVFFLDASGKTSAVHAFEWAVGSDF